MKFHGAVLLLIIYRFLARFSGCSTGAPLINIVSVILGKNLQYAYPTSVAYKDVTMVHLRQRFLDVFQNLTEINIYKPSAPSLCPAAGDFMVGVGGEIYDLVSRLHGFTILFSPGEKTAGICKNIC